MPGVRGGTPTAQVVLKAGTLMGAESVGRLAWKALEVGVREYRKVRANQERLEADRQEAIARWKQLQRQKEELARQLKRIKEREHPLERHPENPVVRQGRAAAVVLRMREVRRQQQELEQSWGLMNRSQLVNAMTQAMAVSGNLRVPLTPTPQGHSLQQMTREEYLERRNAEIEAGWQQFDRARKWPFVAQPQRGPFFVPERP